MPKQRLAPRDFVVTDEWGRTLRFYMVGHKFYRRDETPGLVVGDGPEVKEVSKLVYAMRWLDLCLSEVSL